ncbi:MAG: signal recognition particle-docking protein FtsY [Candidatus Aenigmarchaeota archaeon]|nr:signal recognition particle-docking protein FtsY [Candidatus Aenigmarchaeota archaeon]
MFGFLKKKLTEVVDSISGKVKEKSGQQADQSAAAPQQEIQGEIEIETVQRPAERVETTLEVVPEETEADDEAEVIEIDFDEHPSGKTEGAAEEPDSKEEAPAEEEVVVSETSEHRPEGGGFVEVEDLLEKPTGGLDGAKEYVTVEPVIEQRHAEPETKFEEHLIGAADEILPEAAHEKTADVSKEAPGVSKEIEIKAGAADEKKSFFKKLTEKVVKKVTEKKMSRDEVVPMLVDLEGALIEADVAVEVADKIGNDLIDALVDAEIKRGKEKDVIMGAFRKSLLEILDVPKMDFDFAAKSKKPVLVAFWGFNGAGKTTSLAKTASWLKGRGYTCCFAAADTFRAGAEEQLEIHANNIGVKVVKHKYGADPAAVIFDAMEHAKAKGLDFVLADTAGRAHTNASLMEQMKKIVRVNKPDIKILVIDSLTGNDAMEQARSYGEIGVDAVIFTKVDVNEKGGAVLSVTHELKKPIVFLGMGQEYKDFQEFDSEKFVDAILGGD